MERYRDLPEKPTELSDEQIEMLFKEEYFLRPQIDKLNEVVGFDKTGSKLVEHVFDAGILSGPEDAGIWLQESLDEALGTDLKTQGSYDGILGSQTRSILEKAVSQDKIKEVHERFIEKRLEHLKSLPNAQANPGWRGRVEDLRDSQ